jgi:hypothetical protein
MPDAITLIEQDHQTVDAMFNDYEIAIEEHQQAKKLLADIEKAGPGDRRDQLVRQLAETMGKLMERAGASCPPTPTPTCRARLPPSCWPVPWPAWPTTSGTSSTA